MTSTSQPDPAGGHEPPRSRLAEIRTAGMFAIGALGIVHETVVRDAERPYLLGIFVALMGLPAFLPAMNGRGKQ